MRPSGEPRRAKRARERKNEGGRGKRTRRIERGESWFFVRCALCQTKRLEKGLLGCFVQPSISFLLSRIVLFLHRFRLLVPHRSFLSFFLHLFLYFVSHLDWIPRDSATRFENGCSTHSSSNENKLFFRITFRPRESLSVPLRFFQCFSTCWFSSFLEKLLSRNWSKIHKFFYHLKNSKISKKSFFINQTILNNYFPIIFKFFWLRNSIGNFIGHSVHFFFLDVLKKML